MSKPIPGKPYIVQSGDTSETIAEKAYGDSTLSSKIDNANQSESGTGFVTGSSIIIPVINPRSRQPVNKIEDELTVMIEDREISLDSFSLVRSIENGAYGWSGVFPWTPELDTELDELLSPYAYPNYDIFIGSELVSSGILYVSNPGLTDSGRIKSLEGFSYTADAIDSTVKPPYEKNNVTLEQRANELIAPIGITVVIESSTGGPFTRITADPTDKIFSHLVSLAAQRGVLVNTNPEGDIVFRKAGSGGSVGSLFEGDGIVTDWAGTFDGRKRFNSYRSIGQSPGANSKPSISNDEKVPRTRFLTFQMDDTTKGDIKNASEWKRSKQLSLSAGIQLPVNTLFAPDGTLWKENTKITVTSQTLSIPDGFTFLIVSVGYDISDSGKTAILTINLPEVYTGEKLVDLWA